MALAYKPPASLAVGFVTREPQAPAVLSLGQLLPVCAALDPLVLAFRNREPLVLAVLPLRQLLPASVPLDPLVLAFRKAEPLPLALINLKNRLVVRKNRSSSSPADAKSQIAPPG